ncbi:SusC/RagA family TonB-linked outer membrane protein [Flavobacterium nackdongense]|uniref:TonB-dependent receptor n=1 Tax=Flavobacterium nackdongense TaxID=2547394 RepID=A0A4P6YBJ2_9FLAO|nr:TonB-dependent receptor [Flavobacterium nackdongense]QBN19568.1 TonB-dependent receptor [Flavobacterium nackdongense]
MNTKLKRKRTFTIQKLSSSLIIFLIPLLFFGQKVEVKGTIIDEATKATIPGVTVTIKNSTNAVISDSNGNYKIKAANGDIAVFSFVGYATVEKKITGNILNVSLQEITKALNEVVVIGYGSSKKKDLTGSVAQVNSKDFHKAPVTNVEGLIANKVAGVQITPRSGRPGAGSSIIIRGGSSLNASNDPLYVIDGVPLEGSNGGPGVLSQLNPNDIESFTVLKDASAAAIYGSRASNGVIIIVTKKGNLKETKVDFSSTTRVTSIMEQAPVLSADEYRSLVNTLQTKGTPPKTPPGVANTNWQDEIYQVALATENNLSMSGSIKSLPYRVSVGYLNQDGVLRTGNYERFTALLNLSPKFFDNHLKVNLNLKGSFEDEHIANEGALWNARAFDPTQPVRVEDQTYGGYFQYTQFASNPALAIINPVSMLEQVNTRNENIRSVGNLQLDYSMHFLPDLHLNVNAGYDISKGKYLSSASASYFPANLSEGYIYYGDPSREVQNTLFESYLFYSKEIASIKSRFDITAGYSYNDFLTTNYSYPTFRPDGVKQPNSDPVFPFDKPSHSIISFYGRLNYVFNEKYLVTATLRQDGSSRFSEDNRWGLFPSAAFAWKIKEESFLKNNSTFSDLKLRLGYGVTGQQDGIANYYYRPSYFSGFTDQQYTFGNNSYLTVNPGAYNLNLKWEETASSNIGLDFGFLKNRLTASVDVYLKKTKDLLNNTRVPLGFNQGSELLLNIGTMENRGVEFALKAIPIQTDNMTWDLNFNFTYNENKITHLNDVSDEGIGLFSDAILVNTVGYPRNTFYLYHQVYGANGMPIEGQMLDLNNDGLLNASDRYITNKSAAPKYLMGFSTNFQYKKWNLSTAFHANLDHYLFFHPYDNTISITEWQTSQNLSTLYYDTLFSHNDPAQGYSDFYLQNASFLKMDNISIGYDFGKILANSRVGLNLNVAVQNVFIITNYQGLDPEANFGSENAYPVPRIFSIGLNLNF